MGPLTSILSAAAAFFVLLLITRRGEFVVALCLLLLASAFALAGAWQWERDRTLATVLLAAPLALLVREAWCCRALLRRARRKVDRLVHLGHLGLLLAFASLFSQTLGLIRSPVIFSTPSREWDVVIEALQALIPLLSLAFLLCLVATR